MSETKQNDELVKITLFYEQIVYIPIMGVDGQLGYETRDLAPATGLKVWVPRYAIEDDEALDTYISDRSFRPTYVEAVKCWIHDENHEYGGYFKW